MIAVHVNVSKLIQFHYNSKGAMEQYFSEKDDGK
jgi:hypothetical protein